MGAPKPTLGFPSRTDAVLAFRAQGMTTAAIASKLGIHESAVTGLEHSARRSGKAPPIIRHRAVLTPQQSREIAELRERGWSYNRIAARYGVSAGAVHYHCLKQGAITPNTRPIGAKGPRSFVASDGRIQRRFSEDEDRQLEALSMQGFNTRQIAERLGRAMTSVRIRLLTLALHQELRA